jgi:signal transduction histidine kinase
MLRKAWLGTLCASLAALAFLIGAAAAVKSFLDVQHQRQQFDRTGNWIAAQAQIEYLQLVHALDRFASGGKAQSGADLRQRLEIFWSRLLLIPEGAEAEKLRRELSVGKDVDRMLKRLDEIEPLFEAFAAGDLSHYDDLASALAAFGMPLREMVHAAMRPTYMAAQYEAVYAAQSRALVLLIGTVVSGIVLIAVLAWQAAAARRAWREAVAQRVNAGNARSQLQEAVEAMPEGFALFDAQDRLVACNSHFARRYLGTPRERLDALPTFEEVIRRAAVGDVEASIREAIRHHRAPDGRPAEYELGDGRWVRIVERRCSDTTTVGVWADITAWKRREADLREMKNRAEAANRAKSEFLANMSHELRTPLNAILGFSEMMKLGLCRDLDRYREYGRNIHGSGQHLLAVINDILDMSKVEAGKMDIACREIDPHDIVAASLTIIGDRAAAAGVRLSSAVSKEVDILFADRVRLQQILLNLLSNAVRFTPSGGDVHLAVLADPDRAIFSVTDTGVGMDARDIPVALEPFRQVDSSLSRPHEGTGLGLPLAKSLVALHGGELSIASELGVGTTVSFWLPRRKPLAHAA